MEYDMKTGTKKMENDINTETFMIVDKINYVKTERKKKQKLYKNLNYNDC
jgi:hypothetical protein